LKSLNSTCASSVDTLEALNGSISPSLRPLEALQASPERLRQLGEAAKTAGIQAATEIYGGDVWIDITVEEGSIFLRASVLGALTWLSFLGGYKGFKESAIEAAHDARAVAQWIAEKFLDEASPNQRQIYRVERRTKTPGKIKRLSKRLEALDKAFPQLSKRVRGEQLEGNPERI
jgi:hypothetical protein